MGRSRRFSFAACAAAMLVIALASPRAHAQDTILPSRVRTAHPACAREDLDWSALFEVLRAELRAMGSDLADGDAPAEARLSLDVSCAVGDRVVEATLTNLATGNGVIERFELGPPEEPDRARLLALGISEMIRVRWAGLRESAAPIPPSIPVEVAPTPEVDLEALDSRVRGVVEEAIDAREDAAAPSVEAPPIFFDLALAVSSYPAASNATGELRVGVSIPISVLRLGIEGIGTGGWAPHELGDVALGGAGGALSLRLRHDEPSLAIEAGPRLDVGWIHAEGIPYDSDTVGSGLDAIHLALGIDLRVRVRIDATLYFTMGAELGAALIGIDARAEDERVTAQLGPRIALLVGLGLGWPGS